MVVVCDELVLCVVVVSKASFTTRAWSPGSDGGKPVFTRSSLSVAYCSVSLVYPLCMPASSFLARHRHC